MARIIADQKDRSIKADKNKQTASAAAIKTFPGFLSLTRGSPIFRPLTSCISHRLRAWSFQTDPAPDPFLDLAAAPIAASTTGMAGECQPHADTRQVLKTHFCSYSAVVHCLWQHDLREFARL